MSPYKDLPDSAEARLARPIRKLAGHDAQPTGSPCVSTGTPYGCGGYCGGPRCREQHCHLMSADKRDDLESVVIQDPPCIDRKREGLGFERLLYGFQQSQGEDWRDRLELGKQSIFQIPVKPTF